MTEFSAPFTKRTVDPFLIAFGVLIMIVSGYSIWSTSYKLHSAILASGKIVTCRGGCKYKGPDDYFWLGGHNNLAVMDKSMVFTPSQSSASIVLNSGTKLTLYPNSLVRITINQKGSVIDIIEGKINFDKIVPNAGDKIMLRGKEIELPRNDEKAVAGISTEAELLELKTPDVVYLRGSSVLVPIEVQKGSGPFHAQLEGSELDRKSVSDGAIFSHNVQEPGIHTLKVEDAKGAFATKLLNVIDLRVPKLNTPINGDTLYSKSFLPSGQFDPQQTEFSLSRENTVVYKGLVQSIPRDLAPGNYKISSRKVSENQTGDWSLPISFKLVNSKKPHINIPNGSIFFDKVHLRWKKILPALHLLTIKNMKTSEEFKLALSEESFVYSPNKSGKFAWSIKPLLQDDFNEKIEPEAFTLINLSTLLLEPNDRQEFLTSELKEEVKFKWMALPDENISLSLEIKSDKDKSFYSVTGKDSLLVELANLKHYQWRLVFKTIDQTVSTPEKSFKIEPPPPAAPIREDEIIFKE